MITAAPLPIKTETNHLYQKAVMLDEPAEETSLLDHAIALFAERGPKGVTTRAVTERAGVSPALLNYRYGSHDRFLERAMQRAAALDAENWRRRAESCEKAAIRAADLPGLLQTVLRDDFVTHRDLALCRWISLLESDRSGARRSFAETWMRRPEEFWARLYEKLGLDLALSKATAAILLFMGQGYLLHHDAFGFDPWARDLCDRLAERILKKKPSRPGDSPWRMAAENAALPSDDADESGDATRRNIIEGAVGIILKGGADAVTHRAIAARAGVSLSSTTHHFASKSEIIIAAYRSIYRRAVLANPEFTAPPPKMSIEDFDVRLKAAASPDETERRAQTIALDDLALAASRIRALQPMAIAMFARSGEHSARVLKALAEKRGDTDRLDGQLLRFLMSGLFLLDAGQKPRIGVAETTMAVRKLFC